MPKNEKEPPANFESMTKEQQYEALEDALEVRFPDDDALNGLDHRRKTMNQLLLKLLRGENQQEIEDLECEQSEIFVQAFNQLISNEPDAQSLFYSEHSIDEQTKQIYGHKVKMDKIYSIINQMVIFRSESKQCFSRQFFVYDKVLPLLQLRFQKFFLADFHIDLEAVKDISKLKGIVVDLYVVKKMQKEQFFDTQFWKDNLGYSKVSAVNNMIDTLNVCCQRLQEVFVEVNAFSARYESSSLTRHENETVNNHMPLLQAAVQLLEEILSNMVSNDQLSTEVNRILNLAQSFKSSSSPSTTEEAIKKGTGMMERIFNIIKKSFFFDSAGQEYFEIGRQHLEKLMMSQIALLKVFNYTPSQRYDF